MKAIMLGAPNPIQAPIIASHKWLRAFGLPVKKLKADATNPNTAAKGRITLISLDWIAPSVDSTLQ